jgi:hypothetical protein
MEFGSSRHAKSNTDSYGYSFRDSYCYSCSHPNGNSNTYANTNGDGNGDNYASCHTDTKIQPVTTPPSNSSAKTLSQVGAFVRR